MLQRKPKRLIGHVYTINVFFEHPTKGDETVVVMDTTTGKKAYEEVLPPTSFPLEQSASKARLNQLCEAWCVDNQTVGAYIVGKENVKRSQEGWTDAAIKKHGVSWTPIQST